MKCYAESSAVLAWLFGESSGFAVSQILGRAEMVVVSELTLLECERTVIRALTLRELKPGAAERIRARLRQAAGHWHLAHFTREIVERARLPFPAEPIRTLDALHLAWALAMRNAAADIELLSLDERIRQAGRQLGFALQPA